MSFAIISCVLHLQVPYSIETYSALSLSLSLTHILVFLIFPNCGGRFWCHWNSDHLIDSCIMLGTLIITSFRDVFSIECAYVLRIGNRWGTWSVGTHINKKYVSFLIKNNQIKQNSLYFLSYMIIFQMEPLLVPSVLSPTIYLQAFYQQTSVSLT